MRLVAVTLPLLLVACGNDDDILGYDALSKQVEGTRVGHAADHWIEMRNMAGEWERTGLIFGYADDYDECTKAITGLKKVNYAREYRCTPAN
ncbi:hypothetical protein U8326_01595 [Tsuneonella sp. CC-YZS046]|uniref:hypothetical protein n=1 Tax=Tsuneonella sp. CC-YZS046 TaxID=3042152 RepID=UPI002D766262|nr:hypothetical protein [Tsuneonella sp. CC-YZS046]WRO66890.1 hypothetical protein U8326_01595 [Tsuneonella sp. CC-YZS046]